MKVTFRRSNSIKFIFCPFPALLHQEQILSFRSRLHFGKVSLSREANKKSQKLFPFVKMAVKYGDVAIYHKA